MSLINVSHFLAVTMTEELPVCLENNNSLKDQSGSLNGKLHNEMKGRGGMCSTILEDRWKICAHEDREYTSSS